MKLEDLKKPFPSIHWRAQTVSTKNPDKPKAMALAYADARDVMDRLDEVCGPENWQDSYVESAKGRVICTISIRIGDQWVSKSDGAGDTAVEGEKGGISDAFKRAAVKWGIGRYLYAMDTPWAECELYNGKWRKWTPQGLAYLNKLHASYTPTEDNDAAPQDVEQKAQRQHISDEQRDELATLIDSYGYNIAEICQAMNIKSLKQIWADQFGPAKDFVNNYQKKAA